MEQRLKGVRAFHFGAFLKRSFRENDFLWGRLDGVERLLNLIGDVGASEPGGRPVPERLIWQGFPGGARRGGAGHAREAAAGAGRRSASASASEISVKGRPAGARLLGKWPPRLRVLS